MKATHFMIGATLLLFTTPAWGWSENTHQKMTADAVGGVNWLGKYRNLKPTSFSSMVRDVLGDASPAGPGAMNFKDGKTRASKHAKYMSDTASLKDPTVRAFARNLLLSNQTGFKFAMGEQKRGLDARQVLAGYSGEPDWGMDKGLDISKHQGLMGGTDPKQTSSQGFRHMSFLLGKYGESPKRAQLFFNLGKKAIQKGHPYWGFRMVAWGVHYLEDMGTPVHTNMLPTLKYIRIKGMVRKPGADGKKRFNRQFVGDLVKGSSQINANYHFLYEHLVDRVYTGARGKKLAAAVKGNGKDGGWLSRKFAPKTVEGVAKRRAWSRLSTPGIARNVIKLVGQAFRKPAPGKPANSVVVADDKMVQKTITKVTSRRPGESRKAQRARIKAGRKVMRSTERQFRKNGRAVRRAMAILGNGLGHRR